MRLVVARHDQRRVLLGEAVQGVGQLVVVGLGGGHHGDGQHRFAGGGAGTRTGVPRGASVSPVAVPVSLATAARSPAGTALDVDVVEAAQGEQTVQALVAAGAGVHEVIVGVDRARQHLEQRDLPDVAIDDRS